MDVLVLAGIDNAGKSTTIRESIGYLGVKESIVRKFNATVQYNPPKKILINETPIYIYITSPQEISKGDDKKSVKILSKRLKKEYGSKIIITLNIDIKYEKSIIRCLDFLREKKRN